MRAKKVGMPAMRCCQRYLINIVLAVAITLLCGCSTIRIAYNQADTILSWIADDYFDLDAVQRQDLNARLEPLLAL